MKFYTTISGDEQNSAILSGGISPTLQLGVDSDADSKIIFETNTAGYHIGWDQSADALVIGAGYILGTTPAVTFDRGATSANMRVKGDHITSGYVMDVQTGGASSITTGNILRVYGGTGSTDTRNMVYFNQAHASASGTTAVKIDQANTTSPALWVDTGNARFDGNVGIGSTAPSSSLHIDVDSDSGSTYGIVQNDGTANNATIAGWVIRDGSTVYGGIQRRRDGSTSPIEIGGFTSDAEIRIMREGNQIITLNQSDEIDFNSFNLTNVGASGNDWDATGIDVIGTAASTFKRTTSTTNSEVNSIILRMVSDGDAADGFAPQILFQISDTGVTNSSLGGLSFERAGADNTGLFNVNVTNAGSGNDALKLTAPGVLSVDLAGSGSAAQVDLFDEYDDPVELQRYTHMQSDKFSNENERKLSISRMLDMGVISEVPTSASGYHMNLQPMLRLVAGGIYQNRERIDSQYDEIDKRLAKIEQALGV